jgi:hypothetical protein
VAIGMAMLLLSIITLCPVMACPLTPATKTCCHRPGTQTPPCPQTIQKCPYLLLDKGETAAAAILLALALQPASPDLPVLDVRSFTGTENRLPDSSDLYLRIRVLLI